MYWELFFFSSHKNELKHFAILEPLALDNQEIDVLLVALSQLNHISTSVTETEKV